MTNPPTRRRLLGALIAAVAALSAPVAAHASATPRVVGGTVATEAQWPSTVFVVGMRDTSEDGQLDPDFACTGSLVAPQWVITAAHCMFNPDEPGTLEPGMVVVAGVADYLDPAAVQIKADQMIPDPSFFQSPGPRNDIALVHLATPSAQPVMALPQDGVTYGEPPNVPNFAGWGLLDEASTQQSSVLHQAYLPFLDQATCATQIAYYDPGTMMCAINPGVSTVCHGDSGGPLVAYDPATNTPVLWAITSYGTAPLYGGAACSLHYAAAFTRINAFAPFITQHTGLPVQYAAPAPPVVPPAPPPTAAVNTADHSRPVITNLGLSRYHFRVLRSGAKVSSTAGAVLGFRLSEPAAVTVTVQRASTVRHRTTWKTLSPTVKLAGRTGVNSSVFSGRLGAHSLLIGTYRLSVQAVDPSGNRSLTGRASFKIVS